MILSKKNALHSLMTFILITTFPTKSMETTSLSIQRPIIMINLSIDHHTPFGGRAHYTGKKYYEHLNKKCGIKSSIQNQQKMPLICPIAIEVTSGKDWVYHTSEIIGRYELGEKYTDDRCIFLSKQFPHSIPIDLLYNRTTGERINLTVYGYPVIAICTDNPATNLSFKEQLNYYINNFKEKPSYVSSVDTFEEVYQQLIEAGLIGNTPYNRGHTDDLCHGTNGFINIEKLILEDKNISHIFNYLKQREIGKNVNWINKIGK